MELSNQDTLVSYRIRIYKFTLEDKDGFRIYEYEPLNIDIIDVTLKPNETYKAQGNFYFTAANLKVANSITVIGPWAVIVESN